MLKALLVLAVTLFVASVLGTLGALGVFFWYDVEFWYVFEVGGVLKIAAVLLSGFVISSGLLFVHYRGKAGQMSRARRRMKAPLLSAVGRGNWSSSPLPVYASFAIVLT